MNDLRPLDAALDRICTPSPRSPVATVAAMTPALKRIREAELARPLKDRLWDALLDAGNNLSLCTGEGADARQLRYDDVVGRWEVVRGPDHNAYKPKDAKHFDEFEGALSWFLAK